MKMRFSFFAAASAACTVLSVAPAQAQIAYTLGNGGTNLLSFDLSTPGSVNNLGAFSGGIVLNAIDFRPLTGQLYGYSDATDSLYVVNTTSGALTLSNTGTSNPTNTDILGIDFNPAIDRVRVVTDSAQNLVYNPNVSSAPTTATDLFYGAADVAAGPAYAGRPLRVIENGYTNSFLGSFGLPTMQFGIDVELGSLVTIANNAGTLGTVNGTVGNLGLGGDITPFTGSDFVGFDIFGATDAYAIFNGDSAPTLYSVNLTTGAATSLGALGGGNTNVYSLAIAPSAAPEPGTFVLAGLGVLLAGAVRVVRRRA